MEDEQLSARNAKGEIDRLAADFFRAVSFDEGARPAYDDLYKLFLDNALLIKNSGASPEISNIHQFIEPRQRAVIAGELACFSEVETAEITELFGNVAHRFSTYAKRGTLKGVPFEARGMISTQFIKTPAGWRMSGMAWDDERPGLAIPEPRMGARSPSLG